jgi:hypothetical protein
MSEISLRAWQHHAIANRPHVGAWSVYICLHGDILKGEPEYIKREFVEAFDSSDSKDNERRAVSLMRKLNEEPIQRALE